MNDALPLAGALALAMTVAGCATETANSTAAADTTPIAGSTTAAGPATRGTIDAATLTSANSRSLGDFATEADAVAAARGAALAAGTYGLATVGNMPLAITGDGTTYQIAGMTAPVGSGAPQRPPQ